MGCLPKCSLAAEVRTKDQDKSHKVHGSCLKAVSHERDATGWRLRDHAHLPESQQAEVVDQCRHDNVVTKVKGKRVEVQPGPRGGNVRGSR